LLVIAADVPLKLTFVAPARPVPVIVTEAPIAPFFGARFVIFGVTVKFAAVVMEPPDVVTVIGPVVAAFGTVVTIDVAVLLLITAAVPLKETAGAANPVPLMVTLVPAGPLAGEKPEIVGTWTTVKVDGLVATPPGVVTETNPVVAAAGTIAVIANAVSPVIVAAAPLNVTDVAPLRFVPEIVTAVPVGPVAGARPVIVGARMTVKLANVV